jgi:ABC-2 type transport system ATP-binding protein
MSEQPAVEAIAVSKRYSDRDVLASVDLIARHGQVHGVLGPNGAGKTTLIRVLMGLVQRDAGSVRLLGSELDSSRLVPEGVAGSVETPSFYPYLSGRHNLDVLARLDGGERSRRGRRIDEALERVGLGTHASMRVSGYSAGMRQRLGLAAVLIRAPRLLFLDEPTSSLDPAGARDVRALAKQLADEGAAVVLSSHDMAEVEELCTTLTVINHGCGIFSGTVDDLRQRAPSAIHALRTNDDHAALDIASKISGVKAASAIDGGLQVSADIDALDAYVIALGHHGIAVRALERRVRTLESLFLELTSHVTAGDNAVPAFQERTHAPASAVVS